MSYIKLNTEIPGPNSQALLARRQQAVSGALFQAVPIAVQRASGSLVEDVDGNILIDLVGGIGALAVGHAPASVVEAVREQAQAYLHVCSIIANYEPYVALCETLNQLTPGDFPKKTLLSNGGAEAVENAVKIARAYTKRSAVMVFEGAYHGRTNLTMAMTSKYGLFKKGFGPFAPEVYRLPAPNLYRTPTGMSEDDYLAWCIWNLENALIAQIDPSALAAVVIEPVLGEGGFIPMPAPFLQKIRALCDAHGVVMIVDEIQSGFGRTGKLFATEHSSVVPDLVVSAKSLAAGMPLSAVTGRAEILDAPHLGGVGSTYGGNPVACAAALEAVKHISKPQTLAAARRVEQVVREVFEPLQQKWEMIGDVRGLGAMMAVEFVRDKWSKAPLPEASVELMGRCIERGVMVMRAGLYGNCVRFLPQLDIPEDQLREALAVVAGVVQELGLELCPAVSV